MFANFQSFFKYSNLALPFPFIDHSVSWFHHSNAIFAHPFIENIPVKGTAKTAMLSAGRWRWHHLDENVISSHPDTEEWVHMDCSAPLGNLEDFDIILFESFFSAICQGFDFSIDGNNSLCGNFDQMSAEVSLDRELVADLLGEHGVGGGRAAMGWSEGPAGAGVVGVSDVVVGLDGADGGDTRICGGTRICQLFVLILIQLFVLILVQLFDLIIIQLFVLILRQLFDFFDWIDFNSSFSSNLKSTARFLILSNYFKKDSSVYAVEKWLNSIFK